MHFQGQNLNFLVKILYFTKKYATSNVQIPFYLVLIFAGFLLFFGQKNGKRQNGKNGKKNPAKTANGKRQTANAATPDVYGRAGPHKSPARPGPWAWATGRTRPKGKNLRAAFCRPVLMPVVKFHSKYSKNSQF